MTPNNFILSTRMGTVLNSSHAHWIEFYSRQNKHSQGRTAEIVSEWNRLYDDWDVVQQGPAPLWWPDADAQHNSNLARWLRELDFTDFQQLHRWSREKPSEFWSAAAARLGIRFSQAPRQGLESDESGEHPRWFPDGELNIVESCFSAPGEAPAIIAGSSDGTLTVWTYAELRAAVQNVAGNLRAAGYGPGDAVAVVLPMTAQSVAIYLGLVWAGCVVVSIADSFAPKEIANRLRIANARAVFTYDFQFRNQKKIEMYSRVVAATDLPIIVLPAQGRLAVSLREQDHSWDHFSVLASGANPNPHRTSPEATINILFSSGTTGDPKAIPWNHTTPIKCALDGHCHQDIRPGQVTCWPTNLGWMMGPFLIFATLVNRGAIALYEDAPQGSGFGRFIQEARVNMLGVIPTLVKSWKATREMEEWDWSAIHVFSSTGESSHPDDMLYLSALAGVRPIIEYCGGTEIGGGYISSTVLHPNIPSAFTTPTVGNDFVILSETGELTEDGELFLVPPALGLSTRLLNRDHHATYFEDTPSLAGYPLLRRHGDHFRRLPGPVWVAGGRVDDTMNLGGIKISSAELERVMNQVAGVRETAAIALARNGGPEELVVFAVVTQELAADFLLREFNQRLKSDLNPLFRASEVHLVRELPRTASNKVMRRLLRDQLQG